MDSSPTEDLVFKAKSGCRQSLDLLVEMHQARLEALIYLRLRPPLSKKVTLGDVYQNTWLQATRSLSSFEHRGKDSFYHWLTGIADHAILNLARHHLGGANRPKVFPWPSNGDGSNGSVKTGMEAVYPGPAPGDSFQERERFEHFKIALGGLKKVRREAIILTLVYSLQTHEVARRLGKSRDAAAMILHRAVLDLQPHFRSTNGFRLSPTRIQSLREEFDVPSTPPHGNAREPPEDGQAGTGAQANEGR